MAQAAFDPGPMTRHAARGGDNGRRLSTAVKPGKPTRTWYPLQKDTAANAEYVWRAGGPVDEPTRSRHINNGWGGRMKLEWPEMHAGEAYWGTWKLGANTANHGARTREGLAVAPGEGSVAVSFDSEVACRLETPSARASSISTGCTHDSFRHCPALPSCLGRNQATLRWQQTCQTKPCCHPGVVTCGPSPCACESVM